MERTAARPGHFGEGTMAHLSLCLLGPFQARLEEQLVTRFKSSKARALLAYLATEADRPHRREVLAGLLWPDYPNRDALNNLRFTLSALRRAIDDRDTVQPFIHVTHDELQFNLGSNAYVDVAAFGEYLASAAAPGAVIAPLEQAVALYRDSFLAGFSLPDSSAFEEWLRLKQAQFERQAHAALHRLAELHAQRGEHEQSQAYAWRQLELVPWDEGAHRQLMRALALSGRRAAALAQYETCCRALSEELGVHPEAETTRLYEQIRDGTLLPLPPQESGAAADLAPQPPSPLPSFLELAPRSIPPFVAREREQARLEQALTRALNGEGRVTFVIGEAGSGKTALLQAFARRAGDLHSDLRLAFGNCNAYTGIGDPYLPFREILGQLTGDVEAKLVSGAITQTHARRLWLSMPQVARVLLEEGRDLIGTFVPSAPLLTRTRMPLPEAGQTALLSQLEAWTTGSAPHTAMPTPPEQRSLFEQVSRVLQILAGHWPLLLFIDDLQWADLGSISLLFHLGRHLTGSRILLVGAYRTEEISIRHSGERHALEPVVNELRRDFGDITIDLGEAQHREFLEEMIDGEPNRLGVTFRDMLYRQTRGHPLTTVELLHGLQQRGDLVLDVEGRWIEGPTLDWEALPARVEAVIAERVDRLPQPLREILQIASVEGEFFTAEVVADVSASKVQTILAHLSGALDRQHRLVRAERLVNVGDRLISRYRFCHILFQRYLYRSLDEVERTHLHAGVGRALESLYHEASDSASDPEIGLQLAQHFEEARMPMKAITYLRQAGERALRLAAYQEAGTLLTRALSLVGDLPASDARTQEELSLQLSLGKAWIDSLTPEREQAYARALELCDMTEQASEFSCALSLGGLAVIHYVRADHPEAISLAEEALTLGEELGNPLLESLGHWYLGFIFFAVGDYTTAKAHLEKVLDFYDPSTHHRLYITTRGSDVGVSAMAYHACCLWCLGFPDHALRRAQSAIDLARRFDHAFTLADVLCYAGCLLSEMRGDQPALQRYADELVQLAEKADFKDWLAIGVSSRGAAQVTEGQIESAIADIRTAMAFRLSYGARCYLAGDLRDLAEAYQRDGRFGEAIVALDEALDLIERTHERHWEAEVHRTKAAVLLSKGDEDGAEASLLRALAVARRQHARSWELRTAIALSRLWQTQGKREQAHELLTGIYRAFTEGFSTPDLVEAQHLLDELAA